MKKLLLILCFILSLAASKAQVEFAPPGSVWRNAFYTTPGPQGQANYLNAEIIRVQDSVVDNETVKVLRYHYFYVNRLSDCGNKVLIRQKGDTVFMRNCHTGHTWQVLYNFAAAASQTWTTTIRNSSEFGAAPITHTTMVNAVSSHTLNGMLLKKLSISICYPDTSGLQCYGGEIMELLGDSRYMFNYFNLTSRVSVYGEGFFCYHDSAVSAAQFNYSYIPCNYDVGIIENSLNNSYIKVYPQPAGQSLNIELGEYNSSLKTEIHVCDLSGRILFMQQLLDSKTELDLSTLNSGIYFLKVLREDHVAVTQKIIK